MVKELQTVTKTKKRRFYERIGPKIHKIFLRIFQVSLKHTKADKTTNQHIGNTKEI